MNKLIVNYSTTSADKRLVIDRDLPFSQEILYAVLYLHAARIVTLKNILPIREVVCA